MTTIVRKEYRKPYALKKGGYPEVMRTKWEKSLWNQFLETDPGWAEFVFIRNEVPDSDDAAGDRRLRYLKQSEFKKPYDSPDYTEMEYTWTGPHGPGPFRQPGRDPFFPDQPWNDPGGTDPDWDPSRFVCDANCEGTCCYCPGITKDFGISATYPIVGVETVFGMGATADLTDGYGQNSATVTVDAPSGASGSMTIRVWMALPNGNICDSTFNILKCSDDECCPDCDLERDPTSDETAIAPGGTATVKVTGGTPPFYWKISTNGGGGWSIASTKTANRQNTVTAGASACGSCIITVEDSCGCRTTISVREPNNGQWVLIYSGQDCHFGGAPDSPCNIGASATCTRTSQAYKQVSRYTHCKNISSSVCGLSTQCPQAGGDSCSKNSISSPACLKNCCAGEETECVTISGCSGAYDSLYTSGGSLCCSDESPCSGGEAKACYCYCNFKFNFPSSCDDGNLLYEWQCP